MSEGRLALAFVLACAFIGTLVWIHLLSEWL